MAKLFIAPDGSWGDATGLRVVDATDEQISELNELTDHEAEDYVSNLPDIAIFH